MSSAHGYPRWQTAPPTSPHVEAQKAARDRRAPRDPLAADPAARRVYRLRPPAGRRGSPSACAPCSTPSSSRPSRGRRGGRWCWRRPARGRRARSSPPWRTWSRPARRPRRSMLVTFTRRAARQMVDRAARLSGADLSRGHGGHLPRGLPPPAAPLRAAGRRPGELHDPRRRGPGRAGGDGARRGAGRARERGRRCPKPSAIVGFAALAAESGGRSRTSCSSATRAWPTGSTT